MKTFTLFLVLYLMLFMPDYFNNPSKSQDINFSKAVLDTNTAKYYPLCVGNVYKYHFAASSGINYNYKVRIIKDTVINSRRYFVKINTMSPSSIDLLRFDTLSGNIYRRVTSGYCSYSPFELLSDSLRSRIKDTSYNCTSISKHICIDTGFANVFSNNVKRKVFKYELSEGYISYTYAVNYGVVNITNSDSWGVSSETLTGCYINGVLFGDTLLTEIEKNGNEIPVSYFLSQNYPNPFNPNTNIRFQIKDSRFVTLNVYDIVGKKIATLVNEKKYAGVYEVTFDGSNLPSGIYFYKLTAGDFSETKKMILLK